MNACQFQVYKLTRFLLEVKEELLVEYEGHPTDLLHASFCRGVPVHKVGRDGDGQLPTKLLPTETCVGLGWHKEV